MRSDPEKVNLGPGLVTYPRYLSVRVQMKRTSQTKMKALEASQPMMPAFNSPPWLVELPTIVSTREKASTAGINQNRILVARFINE